MTLTIRQLLQNYSIELMSPEPKHQWYRLSFHAAAKDEQQAKQLLNQLTREANELYDKTTK